ncbi:hypothetical protein OAP63_04445 [Vibrio sp.]|nr:hypothetical protein [Vibrio sp.]
MDLITKLAGFRKRKAHVYCIGAAKTGTTSIAQIYNGPLRAAHEPSVTSTTDLVISYLSGDLSDQECIDKLRKRDKSLNLELESSHPLGYLAPFLIEMSPKSKFIVTIRNPNDWLKSRINFHLKRKPDEWDKYRQFIWSRHHSRYEKEELILEQNQLFSLDAYLKQYSEQYQIIFDSIPEERRLVIKTDEISYSLDKMNGFMGLNKPSVEAIHTNKMDVKESIYDLISKEFIEEKVNNSCGWILNKYFE